MLRKLISAPGFAGIIKYMVWSVSAVVLVYFEHTSWETVTQAFAGYALLLACLNESKLDQREKQEQRVYEAVVGAVKKAKDQRT